MAAGNDFRGFIAHADSLSKDGANFDIDKIRRLWAGVFKNDNESQKIRCLRILRRTVLNGLRMGGKKFLDIGISKGWTTYKPEIDVEKILMDPKDSPLCQFKNGKTILIGNMVSGITYTPLVLGAMISLHRRPRSFALFGWSKNGDTAFEDSSTMRGFWIHPHELNRIKSALADNLIPVVVDDCEALGVSFNGIKKELKEKIGFPSVYKLVGNTGIVIQ